MPTQANGSTNKAEDDRILFETHADPCLVFVLIGGVFVLVALGFLQVAGLPILSGTDVDQERGAIDSATIGLVLIGMGLVALVGNLVYYPYKFYVYKDATVMVTNVFCCTTQRFRAVSVETQNSCYDNSNKWETYRAFTALHGFVLVRTEGQICCGCTSVLFTPKDRQGFIQAIEKALKRQQRQAYDALEAPPPQTMSGERPGVHLKAPSATGQESTAVETPQANGQSKLVDAQSIPETPQSPRQNKKQTSDAKLTQSVTKEPSKANSATSGTSQAATTASPDARTSASATAAAQSPADTEHKKPPAQPPLRANSKTTTTGSSNVSAPAPAPTPQLGEVYVRADGTKVRRVVKKKPASGAQPNTSTTSNTGSKGTGSKQQQGEIYTRPDGTKVRRIKVSPNDKALGEVYTRADGKRVRRVVVKKAQQQPPPTKEWWVPNASKE